MTRRTIIVHAVAEDGLPDMDRLAGRVALISNGAIISGQPIIPPHRYGATEGVWEGERSIAVCAFAGVTHWIEFDVPTGFLAGPMPAAETGAG